MPQSGGCTLKLTRTLRDRRRRVSRKVRERPGAWWWGPHAGVKRARAFARCLDFAARQTDGLYPRKGSCLTGELYPRKGSSQRATSSAVQASPRSRGRLRNDAAGFPPPPATRHPPPATRAASGRGELLRPAAFLKHLTRCLSLSPLSVVSDGAVRTQQPDLSPRPPQSAE